MVAPASYEGMSADAYIGKLKKETSSQKRKISDLERKLKHSDTQIYDMKTALLKAQEFVQNNDSVIRALQEELAQYRAGGAVGQFNESELAEKLYLANSQAEAIVSGAVAKAAEILSTANYEVEPESEKIIDNAKLEANEIINNARLEAQNIINSANTTAAISLSQLDETEVVIQAQQRADAIVQDAKKVAKSIVVSAKQELEIYSNIDDPSNILEHANLMAFDIVEQARASAEHISIEANNIAENSRIAAEELINNATAEAESIRTAANDEVEAARLRLSEIDKEIQQRLDEVDASAKQRADEIIAQAQAQAQELEASARNKFNEVTTNASEKAVELENAAKVVADRITAEATARAIEIENQAMQRANDIIMQVNSHYNPMYGNPYMMGQMPVRITAEATARAIEIENQAMQRANDIIMQVNSHYNPMYGNPYMMGQMPVQGYEYAQQGYMGAEQQVNPAMYNIPPIPQEYEIPPEQIPNMYAVPDMPQPQEPAVMEENPALVPQQIPSKYADDIVSQQFAEPEQAPSYNAEATNLGNFGNETATEPAIEDKKPSISPDESKKIISSAMSLLDQMMEDLDS